MSISEEMERIIENEMSSLDELLRSGCAYDDFMQEFSRLLGQAEVDQAPLMAAGFRYEELMPKYGAYHEKLALEHGERVNAEVDGSEAADAFKAAMPEAETDRKRLMAMGRYVTDRVMTGEPKRILDQVRKGRGHVDTLNDNIVMAGFARRYAEIVAEVRPGGQAIDEAFLERVEKNALSLLKLHGQAVSADDETSRRVARQNQLITLCLLAEREIKRFADAAFYDDTDRYNRDYARRVPRRQTGASTPTETPEALQPGVS